MFSKIKESLKKASKNLKFLIFPIILMLCSFGIFLNASTQVNANDRWVDCSKVNSETQMNVKCMTQIVGARCFIPTPDKTKCPWEKSVLGSIFDFFVAFGPIVAVLIIAYGGYQYYFSGFSGNAKGGRQAIVAGIAGLLIIMGVSIYKEFILGFTPENSSTAANATTYSNTANSLGKRIVTVVIVPIVKVLQFAAASFTVISLVFAGYWFIVGGASGDSDASKKGKAGIKNALIGLLIVILSVTIVQLLSNFTDSFK